MKRNTKETKGQPQRRFSGPSRGPDKEAIDHNIGEKGEILLTKAKREEDYKGVVREKERVQCKKTEDDKVLAERKRNMPRRCDRCFHHMQTLSTNVLFALQKKGCSILRLFHGHVSQPASVFREPALLLAQTWQALGSNV